MKNLAKLRKQKKLTQTQLAKMLGVSTSTVAMWETGQRKPDYHTIAKLCDLFAVGFEELSGLKLEQNKLKDDISIPLIGYVRAGYPNWAEENIIGYETIDSKMMNDGQYFALKIRGDSMEPKMSDGDVVIVRQSSTAENGQIAVVLVAGQDATVKKVLFQKDGIALVPTNSDYLPVYYTSQECENLPVTILGVVVELRSRF